MLFRNLNLYRLLAVSRAKINLPKTLSIYRFKSSSIGQPVYSSNDQSRLNRLAVLAASGALIAALAKFYLSNQEFLLAKEAEEEKKEKFLMITSRQKLFFQFASVEYEGLPYMTPQDFLDSVTEDHPRPRIRRKILNKETVEKYLKNTPSRQYGSSRFFRNLEEKGLISYTDYLFLLTIITKPKSNFRIAFNMFDTDGNEKVDKKEFLVVVDAYNNGFSPIMVTQIFKRDSEPATSNNLQIVEKNSKQFNTTEKLIDSLKANLNLHGSKLDSLEFTDTTLLVHLFGLRGKQQLDFNAFKKFSDDLQREILEIEFNEFSKGMNKISPLEFTEILLRYTNFNRQHKENILKRLTNNEESFNKGISFESFYEFSLFMNNLDDFQLALHFHTLANRSISTNEFQRAVKISSGFNLDEQIVNVIFSVFDENKDGQLSYREFIAVLRGRLRRRIKSTGQTSFELKENYTNANDLTQSDLLMAEYKSQSTMEAFRKCVKRKLRDNPLE